MPHQHEFAGFGASHLVTALLLSTSPETSRREQSPKLVLTIKKGREETAGTSVKRLGAAHLKSPGGDEGVGGCNTRAPCPGLSHGLLVGSRCSAANHKALALGGPVVLTK